VAMVLSRDAQEEARTSGLWCAGHQEREDDDAPGDATRTSVSGRGVCTRSYHVRGERGLAAVPYAATVVGGDGETTGD
jgi:hypothetical protein